MAENSTSNTPSMQPRHPQSTAGAKEAEEGDDVTKVRTPPLTKLIGLASPEFGMLFVAFLLMVGSEVTGLCIPLLVANAYDSLVDPDLSSSSSSSSERGGGGSDNRMNEINSIMAFALLLHAAGVIASFFGSSIMGMAGERVVARLRNRLYGAILDQEIAFFDHHQTGELVSRLGSDTTLLQQATSEALPEVVVGVIEVVAAVCLMFWISAELAGLTLCLVFFIFTVCLPFGKWIGKLSKSYQDALGVAQTRSTETLSSMRTVQSFAAEEREKERYREAIGEPDRFPFWYPSDHKTHKTTYSMGYFKSVLESTFFTVLFGVGFASMDLSLWYGFKLVTKGSISLGDLTAFQAYIFMIGAGLGQTSRFLTQLMEARGASGRIFALLERESAIPKVPPPRAQRVNRSGFGDEGDEENPSHGAPPTVKKPDSMQGLVELKNVSFSYPSRPTVPVLENVSLTIPPNTTAAFVGGSGAGKSTIVALLQRFYDVTEGSITIDGHDLRKLDLQWLRSHIGFVQQEPTLFGLSVRENVTYGLTKNVSQERVEEACRMANAHDFIAQWPRGYDTLVGERGVTLSGGQKQRIAIARALLVSPRVLLLDEATSALDAESEHLVQEAIDKAVMGRTVLIVAHRLSTIKRADQIVVVDNHRIIDVGSHDLLLQRCDKYKDLVKRQSVAMDGTTDAVAVSAAGGVPNY